MQQNTILRIFILVTLTVFAVVASLQMFSSQGNVLGNSFRILTPLAIIISLAAPRFAFYLLLAAGAYLDLIKRFMVLDDRFTDLDLAFMLGFAPALVGGLVLKFIVAAISKSQEVSTKEIKLFVVTTLLCCLLGGAQILGSGGLRGAGSAINIVAYLYMPLLVPRIFKNIPDLKRLMVAIVLIYLPAALWAIRQAYFGLEAFEMEYLLSGMTAEDRQLNEVVFRNMGTMVSAHALSMVASILVAALLIPVSWKTGKISLKVWLNPLRLICIWLYLAGAYFTFSRTGWICAGFAVLGFICLQSRMLTFASFFGAIIGLVALYLSAKSLLENHTIGYAQDWLYDKFGHTAEMRQALMVGTFEARLESMAGFVNEESLWTPFGMKFADKQVEVKLVHDILTENLVRVGYIPLTILVLSFLISTFMCFRAMFRMPQGPYRTLMILYFPINFFWSMFLAASYMLYLMQRQSVETKIEVPATLELSPRASKHQAGGRRTIA
jgi:hypothetical protein